MPLASMSKVDFNLRECRAPRPGIPSRRKTPSVAVIAGHRPFALEHVDVYRCLSILGRAEDL